jgi:hypothetical protein
MPNAIARTHPISKGLTMRIRTGNPTKIGAMSGPYAGEKKAHGWAGGGLGGCLGAYLAGRDHCASRHENCSARKHQ